MLDKNVKRSLLAISIVLLAFIGIGTLLAAQDQQDELYKKFDIFVEVLNKIRSEYVETVEPKTIFKGAMKGMAGMLDSESSFMTEDEYEEFKTELAQRTAETGIKVIKHPTSRYAYVVAIIPNSPASQSGIRKGDFIRAVDNDSTLEMSTMMLEMKMKGAPGSVAELSVLRGGHQGLLSFEIPREMIEPVSFTSTVKDGVGYMKVSSFDAFILEEMNETAQKYKQEGVETVIIDVRDNISRNLEEAVHSAELFIASADMLKVVSKEDELVYSANEPAYDFNLLVLVNDATARAAEAFALALQETGAAEIVGVGTLGITTLQREITLEDGAFLNISYATVQGAEGTIVHQEGLKPDVEVDLGEADPEEDIILERAIERAKEITAESKAA